jgi:hypothetical protein
MRRLLIGLALLATALPAAAAPAPATRNFRVSCQCEGKPVTRLTVKAETAVEARVSGEKMCGATCPSQPSPPPSPSGEVARLSGDGWIYLRCVMANQQLRYYAIKNDTQNIEEIGLWDIEKQHWFYPIPEFRTFDYPIKDIQILFNENEFSVTQIRDQGILGVRETPTLTTKATWNRNTGKHTISEMYSHQGYFTLKVEGQCSVGLPRRATKKF